MARHDPPDDASSTVASTRPVYGKGAPLPLTLHRLALRIEGRSGDRAVEIDRDVARIGTAPDNDVVLSDDSVSRYHAELVRTPRGWRVRDLESTNGTTLQGPGELPGGARMGGHGSRVVEAYLADGSVLGLGETRIRVRAVDEVVSVDPSQTDRFGELCGATLPMRQLFGLLAKLSPTDVTVLLLGETGSGKELAARAIHEGSRRRTKPFVVVDAASVAANLVESELFGHERGAFTGADRRRVGAFEAADGGTVFLDEIGELPLEQQPTLLRVLERREVKRVGSNEIRHVDVRVVAATHRDLPKLVAEGRFREDLWFRLAVAEVRLPPLRERLDDLPLLLARWMETGGGRISAEAVTLLKGHRWPGNVRELRNVWERARALAGDETVEPKHLASLAAAGVPPPEGAATETSLAGKSLAEIEKLAIAATLAANKGNKAATSRDLGIAYSTLLEKLKRYGVG